MSDIKEKDITTTVGGEESLLVKEAEKLTDTELTYETEENIVTFDDLGLSKEVLKAVHDLGFESPTPIQERSIPVVLEGRDMIGQAQTGTGKTAAFSLPILSKLDCKEQCIQALVLEPTSLSKTITASIPMESILFNEPKAYKIVEQVIKMLDYDGNADFDFKYNDDGEPVLMEVNPRMAATMAIFKEGGANLPYLRIKQLLGEEIPHITPKYGVTMKRRYKEYYS